MFGRMWRISAPIQFVIMFFFSTFLILGKGVWYGSCFVSGPEHVCDTNNGQGQLFVSCVGEIW